MKHFLELSFDERVSLTAPRLCQERAFPTTAQSITDGFLLHYHSEPPHPQSTRRRRTARAMMTPTERNVVLGARHVVLHLSKPMNEIKDVSSSSSSLPRMRWLAAFWIAAKQYTTSPASVSLLSFLSYIFWISGVPPSGSSSTSAQLGKQLSGAVNDHHADDHDGLDDASKMESQLRHVQTVIRPRAFVSACCRVVKSRCKAEQQEEEDEGLFAAASTSSTASADHTIIPSSGSSDVEAEEEWRVWLNSIDVYRLNSALVQTEWALLTRC